MSNIIQFTQQCEKNCYFPWRKPDSPTFLKGSSVLLICSLFLMKPFTADTSLTKGNTGRSIKQNQRHHSCNLRSEALTSFLSDGKEDLLLKRTVWCSEVMSLYYGCLVLMTHVDNRH